MSGSPDQRWSNGPNAPQIPHLAHIYEEGYFAGNVISAMVYGTPGYASTFQR